MVVPQLLAGARYARKSLGLLFVGLREADDGLTRELGPDLHSGPEALARLFVTLEVGPDCVHELLETPARGPEAPGLRPHLAELLAEAHRCTWRAMKGVLEVAATTRGNERAWDALLSARVRQRMWQFQQDETRLPQAPRWQANAGSAADRHVAVRSRYPSHGRL